MGSGMCRVPPPRVRAAPAGASEMRDYATWALGKAASLPEECQLQELAMELCQMQCRLFQTGRWDGKCMADTHRALQLILERLGEEKKNNQIREKWHGAPSPQKGRNRQQREKS